MAEQNQHIILAISDNDEKKIIRREVEKQRRTQMSILCASLRSLLPFELIKGKRSASDHIGEAVNYIHFLKQNINALEIKRDRLKQMLNSSLVEAGSEADHSGAAVKCVNTINLIPGGVEVAICSGTFEEGNSPNLSYFMEILLQEGCDVVSCVSTHANGRIFHTIKSEVEDLSRLDLAKLQHKLDHSILLSSDELYFQISPDNYYSLPIETTPQNQIFHDPVMDGSGLIPCTSQMGNQQQKLPAWGREVHKITTIDENKKWMHRETEKQRRQEMTRLCTTFRSLLPLEYIKGKRSISDHMHEGTNYIKYLQHKLKHLRAKKDEFMKLSNLTPVGSESGSFTTHNLPICVIVHPCSEGVQIKCSYSFRKYVFPLSRVLDIVLKEGLDVVNCTSTKTDDRLRNIHHKDAI
ncbi:Transcription factor bHLH36, partial [Mucuna pruriens]